MPLLGCGGDILKKLCALPLCHMQNQAGTSTLFPLSTQHWPWSISRLPPGQTVSNFTLFIQISKNRSSKNLSIRFKMYVSCGLYMMFIFNDSVCFNDVYKTKPIMCFTYNKDTEYLRMNICNDHSWHNSNFGFSLGFVIFCTTFFQNKPIAAKEKLYCIYHD